MRPRIKDRHLPACVYQKHGRYWLVKKGKWHDLGPDLSTALAEYGRRLQTPSGGMPDLIDTVFAHLSPKLAHSTRAQYKFAATKLKGIFAEFSPEQVHAKHVAQVKVSLAGTPNMANRVLSFLRQVFNYALEHELIEHNPAISIKRHPERKRDRLIQQKEFDAIRGNAGPRLQVIMDLLFLTGQRISDVLNIRLKDLQDDGILFVQKKTGAKLVVSWTQEMKAAVASAKALHGNVRAIAFEDPRRSPALLPAKQGRSPHYSTVKAQWDEARSAAKLDDITLHDIRAMSLTAARNQGKDATALAGHTNEAMTERYLRDKQTPIVQGPSFRRLIDKAS